MNLASSEFDEYDKEYRHEIENRTDTFCKYYNHCQRFYSDKECSNLVIEFNLEEIIKRYSLGSWFAEIQFEIIMMAKRKCISMG